MSDLERRCVDAVIAVPDHDELGPDYNAIVRAVLAEAGVDELVEALKPFAREANFHVDIEPDSDPADSFSDMVLGDFRRARAALAKIGATQ